MQCVLLSFFWKLHLKCSGFVEKLGDLGGQIALRVVSALMVTAHKRENESGESLYLAPLIPVAHH